MPDQKKLVENALELFSEGLLEADRVLEIASQCGFNTIAIKGNLNDARNECENVAMEALASQLGIEVEED